MPKLKEWGCRERFCGGKWPRKNADYFQCLNPWCAEHWHVACLHRAGKKAPDEPGGPGMENWLCPRCSFARDNCDRPQKAQRVLPPPAEPAEAPAVAPEALPALPEGEEDKGEGGAVEVA